MFKDVPKDERLIVGQCILLHVKYPVIQYLFLMMQVTLMESVIDGVVHLIL